MSWKRERRIGRIACWSDRGVTTARRARGTEKRGVHAASGREKGGVKKRKPGENKEEIVRLRRGIPRNV
jgi:hypothetical protein